VADDVTDIARSRCAIGEVVGKDPSSRHAAPAAHWHPRLADGLAHDRGLVIAKSVKGQLAADVPPSEYQCEVRVRERRIATAGAWVSRSHGLGQFRPVAAKEEAYPHCSTARAVATDCDARRAAGGTCAAWKPAGSGRAQALGCGVGQTAPSRGGRAPSSRRLRPVSRRCAQPMPVAAETERGICHTGHSTRLNQSSEVECIDLHRWSTRRLCATVVGQMWRTVAAEDSTSWRQPGRSVALCEGDSDANCRNCSRVGRAGWVVNTSRSPESLIGDGSGRDP